MRSRMRSPGVGPDAGLNFSINRFIGGSGEGSVAEVPFVLLRGFETGNGAFGGDGDAVAVRSADSRFTILSRGVSDDTGDSTFVLVMASDQVPSSRLTQALPVDRCWSEFNFFGCDASGFPACSSWSGGAGAVSVCGRA